LEGCDLAVANCRAVEFTLALPGAIAWIGGEFRIKGIVRESRDHFASSTTPGSR